YSTRIHHFGNFYRDESSDLSIEVCYENASLFKQVWIKTCRISAVQSLGVQMTIYKTQQNNTISFVFENCATANDRFRPFRGSSGRRNPRASVHILFYVHPNWTDFDKFTGLQIILILKETQTEPSKPLVFDFYRQLNVLYWAASCFGCYDIRDIVFKTDTKSSHLGSCGIRILFIFTPLSFERSSSCSGVIIPMSPHQREALDSSFALI
ncbi:hypothetical protein CSKR_108710, partial [Clonorchis sinensis]